MTKLYSLYELPQKSKDGGGLFIGVLKDITSTWVAQGNEDVEWLAVDIWLDKFPVRIVTAYGPQLSDLKEKKTKFWNDLEEQAISAFQNGAGFILQMNSNAHLGEKMIP